MAKPDLDKLKERKNLNSSKTWRPKTGKNPIRVLAPSSEYVDAEFGGGDEPLVRIAYHFRSHWLQVDDDLHVFRCLQDHDQDCPACNFYWSHRESEDEAIKKVAKDAGNSRRYVMNILDLVDLDKGIQPYECGVTVWEQILDLVAEGEWGDLMSPGDEGRGVVVNKKVNTKNKLDVKYNTEPHPDQVSVVEHLPEGWLERLDELPRAIARDKPRDEVQRLVDRIKMRLGLLEETTTSPPPTKSKAKKKVATKAKRAKPVEQAEEPVATAAEPPPAEEVVEEESEPEDQEDDEEHGEECECTDCRLDRIVG